MLHAWDFCGGWAPALLPVYAELYPVPDLLLLIDGLQFLRDRLVPRPFNDPVVTP